MADASFYQGSFLGGEWSKTYQGRADLPEYGTAMNLSLNGFPIETGAWTRRPGSAYVAHTRGGALGRVLAFDFKDSFPYVLEFTDGWLRFVAGTRLATTNDPRSVVTYSSASPSEVQLDAVHGWSTGDTIQFYNLSTNNLRLLGRQFVITKTGTSKFTFADAVTGTAFDGSTLTNLGAVGTVKRVQEIATPYAGGLWSAIRIVQTELQSILLSNSQPQVLTATSLPTAIADAVFSLSPSNFLDGPYLDPYPGSQLTYDAVSGNVTLTFAFQAYSATTSYNVGDYVTSSGVGYVSLTAANLNNTPASSATNWKVVNGGAPVAAAGFTNGDIGRHIRMFSEPALWAVGTTYSTGNVAKFNGAYYQAIASSTGVTPGTDVTKWSVVTGPAFAQWTWGRILSISGSGLIAPGTAIGGFTNLSAAFDGTISKNFASSATQASSSATTYPLFVAGPIPYAVGTSVYFNGGLYSAGTNIAGWTPRLWNPGTYVYWNNSYYLRISAAGYDFTVDPANGSAWWSYAGVGTPFNGNVWNYAGAAVSVTIDAYAGQDFHSSTKTIVYATVFPSNDAGFIQNAPSALTLNLRAKASAPASASDGTLLGTSGAIANTTASVTIQSNDVATSWAYVWIEAVATYIPPLPDDGTHSFHFTAAFGQVQFFTPNAANGSVITIQLAGPAFLYAPGTVVRTWRAGVFSNSNGWPTCGTYHEGRLWLSGVVTNRVDASKSVDIFNFAPTAPDGSVADNNAIAYPFTAKGVHAVLWMESDERGILCGTPAGEWLIRATDTNNPLTPTNIQAHLATNNGCANIEPRRTGLTLAIVQRFHHSIMEYFADVFSGRFSSPDLTKAAKHLSTRGIEELAYQKELVPILWARCTNGSLIGATYKRESLMSSQGPSFCGWHQHALGGSHTVESICVGPAGASYNTAAGILDTLFFIANDPLTNVRHVSYLTSLFEEDAPITSAWQVDNGIVPTLTQNVVLGGISSFQMSGLWPKNGETATVWAGGLDLGDYAVANGSLAVPFGAADGVFTAAYVARFNGNMPIVVGDTYTSQGQLLRGIAPAATGARNGPALGKRRRIAQFAALLVNTLGLSFGTSFLPTRLNKAILRTAGFKDWGVTTLYGGVHKDTLQGDSSFDEMLCWQITRPYPVTIAALEGFIKTEDQ